MGRRRWYRRPLSAARRTAFRCTRHRLHLEHDERLLPPGALAALWPRLGGPVHRDAGMRPADYHLTNEKLRAQIRAEVAGLKRCRESRAPVAIAEGGVVLPFARRGVGPPARSSRSSSPRSSRRAGHGRRLPSRRGSCRRSSPGTDNQKQRLRRQRSRRYFLRQLLSEPGGSDLASLATKATWVGAGASLVRRLITARSTPRQDRPVGAQAQRHHLLPAGHEKRRRTRAAGASSRVRSFSPPPTSTDGPVPDERCSGGELGGRSAAGHPDGRAVRSVAAIRPSSPPWASSARSRLPFRRTVAVARHRAGY